ncbi:MAG: hypothetical protein ACYDAE_28315 [Steroidobacteraceae bacterium]
MGRRKAYTEARKEKIRAENALLAKYAAYMDEMIPVRNRILRATDFDMFAASETLSGTWIEEADRRLKSG